MEKWGEVLPYLSATHSRRTALEGLKIVQAVRVLFAERVHSLVSCRVHGARGLLCMRTAAAPSLMVCRPFFLRVVHSFSAALA